MQALVRRICCRQYFKVQSCMCGRNYRAKRSSRRNSSSSSSSRTGKLGSFCMVPQLLAGLKMTWLVIGRSVDRATRLSRPHAVRPAAPGAQFDHCHAHFTRSPAIAPTTSTACLVLPSQIAALESDKGPISKLITTSARRHTDHGQA